MPERIDFRQLAEDVDITDVARHLNIILKQEADGLRGICPSCQSANKRALEIIPETNSFRCWAADPPDGKKCLGGDCIALYAHATGTGMYKAAKYLDEQFRTRGVATPPTNPEVRTAKSQPAPFDPTAFAKKLIYSDEVKALGIDEDDAKRLGIGFHPNRRRVFFPVRNPDGTLSGFVGIEHPEAVKMPPRWIVPSNVVRLRA